MPDSSKSSLNYTILKLIATILKSQKSANTKNQFKNKLEQNEDRTMVNGFLYTILHTLLYYSGSKTVVFFNF